MQGTGGIQAPESVEAGSTGEIVVYATGATQLSVVSSATGTETVVNVVAGVARFELPAGATANSVLTVVDNSDRSRTAAIVVTPGSV